MLRVLYAVCAIRCAVVYWVMHCVVRNVLYCMLYMLCIVLSYNKSKIAGQSPFVLYVVCSMLCVMYVVCVVYSVCCM